jgi:O-methyltransferase
MNTEMYVKPQPGANALERVVNRFLRPFGRLILPIPAKQVIPPEIPDSGIYGIPDDLPRLYQPWFSQENASLLRPEVKANTLLSPEKLYSLRQMARTSIAVPGDIFEAGAGSGGSTRVILDVLREAGSTKRIWSLDTFEGYQKVDPVKDGAHVQLQGCRCASLDDVSRLLSTPNQQVVLIPGLIPGTLSQVKAQAISFAHIDVNLHEPTLASTEFVLNRLSPWGIIVFDDYAWPATYGARTAIDQACRARGLQVTVVPHTGQAFLINSPPVAR